MVLKWLFTFYADYFDQTLFKNHIFSSENRILQKSRQFLKRRVPRKRRELCPTRSEN